MQNREQEGEREMCSWFPGSWLPIIITLVILHTSFPFIFDTLHLFLIMWNLNINTLPGLYTGHFVLKK